MRESLARRFFGGADSLLSVVDFSSWLVLRCNRQFLRAAMIVIVDSETTGMSDMTKLVQHIAEMNTLLIQTTTSEQSLVKALGDALSQVDHQLVRDIRKVALEHQARRAEVFLELQALACSIGMFPHTQEEVAYVPPANDEQAFFQPSATGAKRSRTSTIRMRSTTI